MGWDVPDDWGSYYNNCSRCEAQYHASEGGCGCMDDLECQCGKAVWEGDDDHLRCTECHTGPRVEGNMKSATHCARKAHGTHIRPGDKYIRTVTFGYFPDGARTLSIQKQRIEKGPLWAVAEIIES